MILKFLLILAVIGIVYFMFIKKKPAVSSEKKEANKKEVPKTNDMVECVSCGVYVEIDEALLSGVKYYCSNECLNTKE